MNNNINDNYINFIDNLFYDFNNAIQYCLLRNYEDIYGKSYHDIDVLVKKRDLVKAKRIIEYNAKKYNLYKINSYLKEGCLAIRLYNKNYPKNIGPIVVLFEITTGVPFKFMQFSNAQQIIEYRVLKKIFYTCNPAHEAILLLLKPFYESKLKSKYTSRVKWVVKNHPKEIFNLLSKNLNINIIEKIVSLISADKIDNYIEFCISKKRVIQSIFLFKHPLKTFSRFIFILFQKVVRIFFLKGIIIFIYDDNVLLAEKFYNVFKQWYQPNILIIPSDKHYSILEYFAFFVKIIDAKVKSGILIGFNPDNFFINNNPFVDIKIYPNKNKLYKKNKLIPIYKEFNFIDDFDILIDHIFKDS